MKENSLSYFSIDRYKIFWVIISSILLCLAFWFLSRYPALDAKAVMEGETNFEGIGFDQVVKVPEDSSAIEQIILGTINWMETNRMGMTFGLFFAALMMLIFSLFQNYKSKYRWINSVIGTIIGFPLGVCVNCAAPIAKGVYKGGGRMETALSMMVSSPTLNVVVLTMTFTIFPLYMAAIKLLLSLLVVLVLVPIITHLLYHSKNKNIQFKDVDSSRQSITPFEEDFAESLPAHNLFEGLKWFLRSYLKRFWYIIKKTVPLMILAGLLGNVMIYILPWDLLGEIGAHNPLGQNLIIMFVIAVIGILLPVPIAFDVIVVTVLMASGLQPLFSMVLLFTLGSFSIYSFFIVWQTFHLKLAFSLAIVIVVLSIGGGLVAHKIGQSKEVHRKFDMRYALIKEDPPSPQKLYFPSTQKKHDYETINDQLKRVKVSEHFKSFSKEGVEVTRIKFQPKERSNPSDGIKFKKVNGKEIGLSVDIGFDIRNEFSQISQSSCISAGDIQNDGWQDIVIANMNDVYVFINTGEGNYLRQSFEIKALKDKKILTTVLLDLNNDNWLDLFIGTYEKGNYILLNEKGNLNNGNLVYLEGSDKARFTMAPAFADIDQNASLDIYNGNWSVGMMGHKKRGFKSSLNYIIKNPLDENREVVYLKGPTGETLTTFFTDWNNDGIQDLIVGNDFKMPELFYEGLGKGQFKLITTSDDLVPMTTRNCMSITGVDLDNNLDIEYFMAGSSSKNLAASVFKKAEKEICNELTDPEERKKCKKIMDIHEGIVAFRNTKEISKCPDEYRADCVALDLLTESMFLLSDSEKGSSHLCDFLPSNPEWSFIKSICAFDRNDTINYTREEEKSNIPNLRNENVVIQKESSNTFSNTAEKLKLETTGWSWNAQFADFDNDQFSDVFVNTGTFHEFKREPNHLYQNIQGKEFEEISEKTGLNSFLPSFSSVYTDFDNDGDLDIIVPPALAPIQFYENQSTDNNSIVFQLTDEIGNRQGVGGKIIAYYGNGKHQVQELKASGGYRSFNPVEAWFGLGNYEHVDRISINWSTGENQVFEGPFPAGSRYWIQRLSKK